VLEQPAEVAATELRAVIGSVKRGTLRMFGDWFGRPMDNIHCVLSAVADGDELVVDFDGNEQLRILSPADWEFDEHTFRVQHAHRVVWRWFSYGHIQTPANLFTIEHWIDDDGNLHASSDVDWCKPTFTPSAADPAAELL
jgi:hypothetical protein